MADEYIDIVTEDNQLTGRSELKSMAHREGLWHRAAHVWIYNDQKEILLQKRAAKKELFPDVWDFSVGGHVCAGESVITSAVREVEEEIGVCITSEELTLIAIRKASNTYDTLKNNEFYYVYILHKNVRIDNIVKQETEVADVRWFAPKDVMQLFKDGELLPHEGTYWKDMVALIQDR